ncbi:related to protein kinase Gin4p [Cephalotrichum gorgonifer]|uniref:non-specific serine/threonine protein kinase n=1 Tax=Cephalotrichum gorgonifer TaxID=2041049 RepID=A0AAE8ST41_9PEZI|nr:related to protein kinase Gin4p [Cephalotrichum gorgonifer]
MPLNPPSGSAGHPGRAPLLDVTNRLNNESLQHLHDQIKRKSYRAPEVAALLGEGPVSAHQRNAAARRSAVETPVRKKRESTVYYHSIPEETAADLREESANRNTNATAFNSRSQEGYKTHIGPWQLGKTLGQGSSGMVRLCRHRVTHELAAVKIVAKNSSQLVQAGSLRSIDRSDNRMPERIKGEMRIPMAIEREVAILKLIQHPNIMKLWDIWENRKEIYLVLEYVDHGDLFSYIMRNGRLSEEGTMHFFRQIMSAMSYCHAFNICHRDLKPENILLTSDSQVKIADFRMAALHQTSGHRLHTACGSPHYAAPELLSGKKYMGDKADIWSMGVILYAMLAACLPFDDPDLVSMMETVKRGEYDMPEFLSLEVKDLIRRILQVNPDRRISMKDMWRHPLLQKYDYMDDYQPDNKQPTDVRKEFQYRPFRAEEIDSQLVRQLRSLWHSFSEHELKVALMSDEENDQKIFYWLLQKYRERQLENFNPEVAHSRSDYHHLKPSGWKERRTTREFTSQGNGFRKSISRFTVISRVAEIEAAAHSYDNSTKPPLKRTNSQVGSAKVAVYRPQNDTPRRHTTYVTPNTRAYRDSVRSISAITQARMKQKRATMMASIHGTGSTLNSIGNSSGRQGSPYVRNAKVRRRRGVDFSQVRAHTPRSNDRASSRWNVRGGSVYLEPEPGTPRPDSGVLPPGGKRSSSKKTIKKTPAVPNIVKHRGPEPISGEEIRKFSSSLAKDCDEAFGSPLVGTAQSVQGSLRSSPQKLRDSTPITYGLGSSPLSNLILPPQDCQTWQNRPLPPLPPVSEKSTPSSPECPQAKDKCGYAGDATREPIEGQDGPGEKIVRQPTRLSMPILNFNDDRRVTSAPSRPSDEKKTTSLLQGKGEKKGHSMVILNDDQDRGRIVSAPSGYMLPSAEDQKGFRYLSHAGNTIRVIESPPGPLRTRALLDTGNGTRMDPRGHRKHASTSSQESAGKSTEKRKSWFKRVSKESAGDNSAGLRNTDNLNEHQGEARGPPVIKVTELSPRPGSSESSAQSPPPTKKRKFGLLFWKSGRRETNMSINAGPENDESPLLGAHKREDSGANGRESLLSCNTVEVVAQRNIAVHHNWIGRIFRVKPATAHLCFTISRKRARQEITLILREWRKYGVRDIQVDRQRNIVFARVGPRNYLGMKEVAFAVEVMTVIEHGNPGALSLARFTQERGAASSLHRVVSTTREVFGARRILVADKQKAKMMIKTLNS